jgi:hypothetical protein
VLGVKNVPVDAIGVSQAPLFVIFHSIITQQLRIIANNVKLKYKSFQMRRFESTRRAEYQMPQKSKIK